MRSLVSTKLHAPIRAGFTSDHSGRGSLTVSVQWSKAPNPFKSLECIVFLTVSMESSTPYISLQAPLDVPFSLVDTSDSALTWQWMAIRLVSLDTSFPGGPSAPSIDDVFVRVKIPVDGVPWTTQVYTLLQKGVRERL